MKLNRLILASLIGISLSTPALACDPSHGGGIFSFFHHDSDKDKDKDSHHDNDGRDSHHDCNGGGHSGSGGSSGSSTSTPPAK